MRRPVVRSSQKNDFSSQKSPTNPLHASQTSKSIIVDWWNANREYSMMILSVIIIVSLNAASIYMLWIPQASVQFVVFVTLLALSLLNLSQYFGSKRKVWLENFESPIQLDLIPKNITKDNGKYFISVWKPSDFTEAIFCYFSPFCPVFAFLAARAYDKLSVWICIISIVSIDFLIVILSQIHKMKTRDLVLVEKNRFSSSKIPNPQNESSLPKAHHIDIANNSQSPTISHYSQPDPKHVQNGTFTPHEFRPEIPVRRQDYLDENQSRMLIHNHQVGMEGPKSENVDESHNLTHPNLNDNRQRFGNFTSPYVRRYDGEIENAVEQVQVSPIRSEIPKTPLRQILLDNFETSSYSQHGQDNTMTTENHQENSRHFDHLNDDKMNFSPIQNDNQAYQAYQTTSPIYDQRYDQSYDQRYNHHYDYPSEPSDPSFTPNSHRPSRFGLQFAFENDSGIEQRENSDPYYHQAGPNSSIDVDPNMNMGSESFGPWSPNHLRPSFPYSSVPDTSPLPSQSRRNPSFGLGRITNQNGNSFSQSTPSQVQTSHMTGPPPPPARSFRSYVD